MENKFLKLTNTVYKVLEFFPESDPLKNRAKDKALAIMSAYGRSPVGGEQSICDDIDTLLGYLWIGKSQGWLNSANCLIISNEYEKIKEKLKPVLEMTQKPDKSPEGHFDGPVTISAKQNLVGLTARQSQILDYLGKHEKAQVMDLQTVLPDITKRTIRRDLDELLQTGKIIRSGDFNQVYYKIKG